MGGEVGVARCAGEWEGVEEGSAGVGVGGVGEGVAAVWGEGVGGALGVQVGVEVRVACKNGGGEGVAR